MSDGQNNKRGSEIETGLHMVHIFAANLGKGPDKDMKAMLKRHEQEKEEFQRTCAHKGKKSDWLQHMWAPAHSSGYEVRVCNRCQKEVDKRVYCHKCMKPMTGYKWHVGDGSSFNCVGLSPYCDDCWKPARKLTDKLITEMTDGFPNMAFIADQDVTTRLLKKMLAGKEVFTCGDMVTLRLVKSGIIPHIGVVDGVTKRDNKIDETQFLSGESTLSKKFGTAINIINQARTLSSDAVEITAKRMLSRKTTLINVMGEEDLLFIPLAMAAPLGSVIIYGQPPIMYGKTHEPGIVIVTVSKELKEVVKNIYDRMTINDCWARRPK